MSFFSGFLGGFSEVGSEIIQREDAQKQRINEIVMQGDIQLRNSLAKLKADAEVQQQINAQFLGQPTGQPSPAEMPSVLQMQEPEVDIETGQPVSQPTAFSGLSQPSPTEVRQLAQEYLRAGAAADPQAAMRLAQQDMLRQQTSQRVEDRAAKAEEARNVRFERKVEEDKSKEIRDEWLKETQNKDTPYFKAKTIMPTVETALSDLDNAEKANNSLNIKELDPRKFAPSVSKEAKALQMQKVEGALAKVQQTVGAISNAEMELFGNASISPNNDKQTNANLIAKNRAIQIRSKQYFEFMNEARKAGVSVTDAQLRWTDFVDQTPMLAKSNNGKIELVAPVSELKKDKSWRSYITGQPVAQSSASTTTGQSPATTQVNSFDDFLKSLGQ